jgi:ADP-ribosylglycohydrolase
MTLFTAEGLIRARSGQLEGGVWSPLPIVRGAYLRWLVTQDSRAPGDREWLDSGWLVHEAVLHAGRAPGMTCLGALRAGGEGSLEHTINDSKGCGGVMRVAPVGVMDSPADAFEIGAEAAAITHTHPTGYLAAGALAVIIHGLFRGVTLDEAIERALAELRGRSHSRETIDALARARDLADGTPPRAEIVEQLGGGWIAEEALAIATYCALVAGSALEALLLAVNHGGDSDSTGAICGNIVGAERGVAALPVNLLAGLEARDLIERVADDLYDAFGQAGAPDRARYPGW